jgi:glycosyltransferase involved in cell wall biosynthesis
LPLRELRALAESERAEWFIAHTQSVLPVAAAAARRWNARLGFDCEDLLALAPSDPAEIVRKIEGAYLGSCAYVSVTSRAMAARLRLDYPELQPEILYNVFPAQLAAKMAPPHQRPASNRLRLYWFGQTIGPGKGIEEAIEAAGLLGEKVELHFRGQVAARFVPTLEELKRRTGVAVHFHPHAHYEELIAGMEQFDVGLALERPEHGNYSVTVTNKFFSYLLAGLAIAATDTPGPREIMEQVSGAGFVYPAGRAHLLAEGLERWIRDRRALVAAQRAAWTAARQRFCWEVEQEHFLAQVGGGAATGMPLVAESARG